MQPLSALNEPGSAHLTALSRAIESERPDALFHDPYARQLAGPEGAERYTREAQSSAWGIAVRTSVFDEIIMKTIEHNQVDVVLNLAAGFDMRPYRLTLPSSLRWIEVDLPTIQARKAETLATEQPVCTLERISLDLMEHRAREALLAQVGTENTSERALVITEGLLGYLDSEHVAALAIDLYAQTTIHYWLTDFPPAYAMLNNSNTFIKFAPEKGLKFFEQHGWHVAEFRSSIRESHRLKRTMPMAWLIRVMTWIAFLTSQDRGTQSHSGGFVLLERAAMPEKDEKDENR